MLSASVLGFKYHRIVAEGIKPEQTVHLKADYDYSFVVSYGGFSDHDYLIINKNSCIIDLTPGLDKVFSKFNATSRNEVRRADKMAELKFHFGFFEQDFLDLYKFHSQCEHDRKWFPVPPDEFKNSLIFSSSFNGILISGMSCYTHEDKIRVGRIFSTKRSNKDPRVNNLVYGTASKRLIFNICGYAVEKGFKTFDLGGVDLSDPTKSGISRFKLSFGGKLIPVKIGRWSNQAFKTHEILIKQNGWDLT